MSTTGVYIMSTQGFCTLIGALGAGYIAAKSGRVNELGVIAVAVAGGTIGSAVGKSIENGSLQQEVEKLRLEVEKAELERRQLAFENDDD